MEWQQGAPECSGHSCGPPDVRRKDGGNQVTSRERTKDVDSSSRSRKEKSKLKVQRQGRRPCSIRDQTRVTEKKMERKQSGTRTTVRVQGVDMCSEFQRTNGGVRGVHRSSRHRTTAPEWIVRRLERRIARFGRLFRQNTSTRRLGTPRPEEDLVVALPRDLTLQGTGRLTKSTVTQRPLADAPQGDNGEVEGSTTRR